MIAYITSIGEPTTTLCVWSLERNGFKVRTLIGDSKLANKLAIIYADVDEDFIRVDADVIPNRNLTPDVAHYANHKVWWVQFLTYDWYKQDVTNGGVQLIKKEALPTLRQRVSDAMQMERPESYLYRLEEFHEPRRCITHPAIMGLHNYRNDMERVKQTKVRRNQLADYDFELAERISQL